MNKAHLYIASQCVRSATEKQVLAKLLYWFANIKGQAFACPCSFANIIGGRYILFTSFRFGAIANKTSGPEHRVAALIRHISLNTDEMAVFLLLIKL